MIYIEIYTHINTIDNSIFFEENDFRITSIEQNEFILKEDFNKLLDSTMDIDATILKSDNWYSFGFKRKWEDDGSGSFNQCWFELIETNIIEFDVRN